jgi:hypothetical protein
VELLVVMAALAALTAVSVPLTATAIDSGRARQAAAFAAARFRQARLQAIYKTASVGLVFNRVAGKWLFSVCVDGNRNGIRRAEITGGVDECIEGPHDLEAIYPGTFVALDPSIPDPDGGTGSTDPVRFGAGDIASFSPAGSCTAGSLYLRSAGGVQYAVRINGVLGRTRVLRYAPATGTWRAL